MQKIVTEYEDKNLATIMLRKCGRCRNNVIEMFKMDVEGLTSFEDLLFQILNTPEIKLKFNGLDITCPSCKDSMKDVTSLSLTENDLEILNKYNLKNIWVGIEST